MQRGTEKSFQIAAAMSEEISKQIELKMKRWEAQASIWMKVM